MALLFMDGFDAGDVNQKWQVGGGAQTTAAGGRFGTGRYATLAGSDYLLYSLSSAVSQVFLGFAVGSTSHDTNLREHISIWGDTQATQHLSVGLRAGAIELRRGTVGGTLLGTYTTVINNSTFYYLEVSATIADSGGTCIVRYNGQTVINYTGDTKNGGTNTTIDGIRLVSGGFTTWYDDVYLCDSSGSAPHNTFLGDTRVQTIVPDGAGTSTQFTASSGSNYTTVDELPYSATDYVYSTTSGHRDTYTLGNLSSVTTIFGVQNNVIAKKTDTSALSLKPALKSSSTLVYGSTVALGTADANIRDIRMVDPDTSAAWTQSGVNALESGFEVV